MALPTLDIRPGDKRKPLVFLLHGAAGNASHMTDPGSPSLGFSHDYTAPFPSDRDVGWSWYPGVGPWSFKLDDPKTVRSWQQALDDRGYGTLTYTQVAPSGLLQPAVDELAEVMTFAMSKFSERGFVLLAHSRGGLLVRKFLKDNQPTLTCQVRRVIMLHSPNQGDQLAFVASSLNSAISALKSSLGSKGQQAVDDALGWLVAIIGSPAFTEMAQGSTFLTGLAAGETALPNVEYNTFGGTSVLFSRILAWVYTPGSALPRFHLPPFHHMITMVEVPIVSPIANSLPNLVDEITEGKGDLLVADRRTRVSFAVHRTNSLSHAEALWDENLQAQVLSLLGNGGGIWM
jgi:pimeloyl-ACP methyl ester carboxylesterase